MSRGPTLEVLVGMIASGKSTYAQRRADEGALVICHDELTAMLHTRYRYEPGKRDLYRRLEESLAFNALAAGHDLVVDRTHMTRESRGRWVAWARDYDSLQTFDGRGPETRVVAVVFPLLSAEVHARRRFACDRRFRTYEDWLAVARHHAAQAEAEPFDWRAEGFHGILTPDREALS